MLLQFLDDSHERADRQQFFFISPLSALQQMRNVTHSCSRGKLEGYDYLFHWCNVVGPIYWRVEEKMLRRVMVKEYLESEGAK